MKLGITLVALSALLLSCTKQQAQSADTVAIDLTDAVCAVAEGQPAGQPWVDVVCAIAQTAETGVETAIGTLGVGSATTIGSSAPTIKTVRLRLPQSDAPAFLAAHAAKTVAK